MKNFVSRTAGLLVVAGSLTLAAAQLPGAVDFGNLSAAASGEFVEVNIKSNLIGMVARLAKTAEPDVADLLKGLQGVRVNVLSLNDKNRAEVQDRLKKIRADLDGNGWERIVTAQQQGQDVGVYLKTRGDEAVEGIVVTVVNGDREAVFVNVIGDIRPEKLALVGERFNIEPLKKVGETIKKS